MTTQKKRFIELSDILAVCLECSNPRCGATLCLPISKEMDVNRFRVCPHCQRPWFLLPGGATIEDNVKECLDHLKALMGHLEGAHFKGFLLTLEVKDEEIRAELGAKNNLK